MRILILGARGMVGHMIHHYLQENSDFDLLAWTRDECDIMKDDWREKISQAHQEKAIDVVINCIGVLKKVANSDAITAIKINALFPHELAAHCDTLNARIIHLSTDCWQDLDTYGRSKRAGEIDRAPHLTLRSVVCGPELKAGEGFFQWLMHETGEIGGFVNHYCDGLTNLQWAKIILDILKTGSNQSGIAEVRQVQKSTKYDVCDLMIKAFRPGAQVSVKKTETVDKTAVPDIEITLSYEEQINELRAWMLAHKDMYPQYAQILVQGS